MDAVSKDRENSSGLTAASEIPFEKELLVELEPTQYGWQGFLRLHLVLRCKPKEDIPIPASIPDAYREGYNSCSDNMHRKTMAALDFSTKFIAALTKVGYSVGWFFVDKAVRLRNGNTVGPGVAVHLLKPDAKSGKKVVDIGEQSAIALGNALGYCQDGVQVSLNDLEVGILSGGPIYEALLEHESGDDRLFSETLGLGTGGAGREVVELQKLVTRLEAVQEDWQDEPIREDLLEKLGRQIKRRIKMVQIHDDAAVWDTIKEEIGWACPMFERMHEDQKWEIFKRIKVRLGLAEDE